MLVFTNSLRKVSASVSMVLSMIGSGMEVEAARVGVLLLTGGGTGIGFWLSRGLRLGSFVGAASGPLLIPLLFTPGARAYGN